MKSVKYKRLILLVVISVVSLLAPLATKTDAAAASGKPYFKVYGADVMSGGWFNSGSSCNTTLGSPYQDPTYAGSATPVTKDDRRGGVLAYGLADSSGNSLGGASAQYGAFSLGTIENGGASSYGFYSAGALAAKGATSKTYSTFANDNSAKAPWGGLFQGSVRQTHCIPDYYSKKPVSGTKAASTGALPTSTGVYTASAPNASTPYDLNSGSSGAIPNTTPGTSITIYIDGNVYIRNNITYNLDSVDNVPKFALVVRGGSIYIDPAVTRLDGLYIAQPNPGSNPDAVISADEGDIWTCHDNTTGPVSPSYPSSNCTNPLVVNGALIAKQVNFLRVRGDVGSANTSEDNLSNGLASPNIAEIINYSAAMVFGGPFFNPASSSSLQVQSVVSLPPVF